PSTGWRGTVHRCPGGPDQAAGKPPWIQAKTVHEMGRPTEETREAFESASGASTSFFFSALGGAVRKKWPAETFDWRCARQPVCHFCCSHSFPAAKAEVLHPS